MSESEAFPDGGLWEHDDEYSTTFDHDYPAPYEAAAANGPHMVDAAQPVVCSARGHVPGEVGIWVFVLGDMLAFALFFGVFIVERAGDVALFEEARRSLSVGFAVANTLLLLTSSLFVVMAVRAVRTGTQRLAPRLIALAALAGVGFVVNKAVEYGEKFADDLTPATNDFFTFFFMLTGIHLLHVLIGLCVLAYLWRVTRRPSLGAVELRHVESGASYWHMVDLLWIVLFPLLYLMG